MRASMSLRPAASRSSSSPEPETGRRRVRSPAMIARAERFIASMRRSTRRATNSAPSAASAAKKTSDTAMRADHHRADARAIAEVAPDQQAEAAGQREDARQGAPARRRFVGGFVGRVDDADLVEHAGRQLRDVAGERLAGAVGQEIERRARAGASAPR